MTVEEAAKIVDDINNVARPDKDQEFMLIEALEYLIRETHDTRWMTELGGYYYEKNDFDLALKYYEMADSYGDKWVPEGLGYIWYYGRTGTKDYEKAYKYFSKAAANGRLQSKIKLADMYKNGYYVDQDLKKYDELIEECYEQVKDSRYLGEPKPEVFTRLAHIRTEEGRTDDAIDLYLEAKDFLAQRIVYTMFFGDFSIMKWLINDLYELMEIDLADLDLYDLYYLLKKPYDVAFYYMGVKHEVRSEKEEAGMAVCFDGKWFRQIDDFIKYGEIDGTPIAQIYGDLYDFDAVEVNA